MEEMDAMIIEERKRAVWAALLIAMTRTDHLAGAFLACLFLRYCRDMSRPAFTPLRTDVTLEPVK